jgi:hypothetical protein
MKGEKFVVIAGLLIVVLLVGLWAVKSLQHEKSISSKVLVQGKLMNIRATGAFHETFAIELKFDTGQIELCSYRFMKHWDLRVGNRYRILKDWTGYRSVEKMIK